MTVADKNKKRRIQVTHILKLDNEDGEFVEVWKSRQKKRVLDNTLADMKIHYLI